MPSRDLLEPNHKGKPDSCTGWAYCARTPDAALFLLYFEAECPRAKLSGARAKARYQARWFDPRAGKWLDGPGALAADAGGVIQLPPFPGGRAVSEPDWALKLRLEGDRR